MRSEPNLALMGIAKLLELWADFRKRKDLSIFCKQLKIILRQYPKTVFLIVGDGPLRKDLEKYLPNSISS